MFFQAQSLCWALIQSMGLLVNYCLGLPSPVLSLLLLLAPGMGSSKHLGLQHLQGAPQASALVSEGAECQGSLPLSAQDCSENDAKVRDRAKVWS